MRAAVGCNAELNSDGGEGREQRRRSGEALPLRALATCAGTDERERSAATIAISESGMNSSLLFSVRGAASLRPYTLFNDLRLSRKRRGVLGGAKRRSRPPSLRLSAPSDC
jgi:hypothetical protein